MNEGRNRAASDANMEGMTTVEYAVAGFDLTDPALLQNPYPALAALREAAPVIWYEPSSQWLVTRWADVHAALRDRRLGRIFEHRYTFEEFGRTEPDPRWAAFREHERWNLLSLEPPDHTRIRSLISRAFTPRSIADMRPFMERTASGLLDTLRDLPSFDLLADYAQPYSVAVICELLGVPRSETNRLLGWSHAIVKMYELTTTDDQRRAANTAAAEFMDFIRVHIGMTRARPGDGLMSRLVSVEEEGKKLTDDEIVCTVIVLLNAGHEATVNTIGNGTNAMLDQREQWQRLVTGEVRSATAVEELLRYDGALQLFERWVLEDGYEIAGQSIPVGSEIAMLFGSANRDPRKFATPNRLDIGRGDPTHIGFGGGIHFCIGAPLARLELDVSLAALAEAFPNLEPVHPARFHDTFVIRGLTELRVSG